MVTYVALYMVLIYEEYQHVSQNGKILKIRGNEKMTDL